MANIHARARAKDKKNIGFADIEVGTQSGGYEFEKWFYKLLDFNEIQNIKPYKTNGRQIDGSVTIEGTTYLPTKFDRQITQTHFCILEAISTKLIIVIFFIGI